MRKLSCARLGRGLVLPKDFGLQPIDMQEPGPRRRGSQRETKAIVKNQQIKTSNQNPVLSNECKVWGSWHLAGPAKGGPTSLLPRAFPGSPGGARPAVSSLSGQKAGPGVQWEGGHWCSSILNRPTSHPPGQERKLRLSLREVEKVPDQGRAEHPERLTSAPEKVNLRKGFSSEKSKFCFSSSAGCSVNGVGVG